jgi:hypothetical protein
MADPFDVERIRIGTRTVRRIARGGVVVVADEVVSAFGAAGPKSDGSAGSVLAAAAAAYAATVPGPPKFACV